MRAACLLRVALTREEATAIDHLLKTAEFFGEPLKNIDEDGWTEDDGDPDEVLAAAIEKIRTQFTDEPPPELTQ